MTREEVMVRLRKILESGFSVDSKAISPTATFRGTLRLDSVDVLNLIEDVETTFGFSAEAADYRELHDLSALADFILARLKRP